MTNEDVLIQVIKNLIEENKKLNSSLKMYKHNYGVECREHDELKIKYNKISKEE